MLKVIGTVLAGGMGGVGFSQNHNSSPATAL
jgi:hypothetical protein